MATVGSGELRVVVFTGHPVSVSTRETVEALTTALPACSFLVIQGKRRRVLGKYLRGKLRRLGREPLSYPLELLGQAAGLLRRRTRAVRSAVRVPELDELVEVRTFDDIHGEAALAATRAFAPQLGISIGAPILKPSLFRIPVQGTINLHKSMLPEYRGMPPGFWELHDRAEVSGASVHWMEEQLDTGAVILQRELRIPRYPTVGGLAAQLDLLGTDVLVEAVRMVLASQPDGTPQGVPRTATRGRPPALLRRAVERRLRKRRTPPVSRLRELAKWAVLMAYLWLWVPPRNLLRRVRGCAHVTILLYHRISEEYLDSVTVGVGQFIDQIRLLRRSCDVIDLAEFLASRGRPRRRPAVVITFDDGYADNLLAAMLLRREGLPATFFVSTRIVGTDQPFPHDRRQGLHPPVATWPAVRRMAAWGHHVSNHTAHHVDLGAVEFGDACREIRNASLDLVERLGPGDARGWLAFPYGRPQNLMAEVRQALPSLSISHCFSAYGGTNRPGFDPLDVLRQGISYRFGPLLMRAVAQGWPVDNTPPPRAVREPAEALVQNRAV